MHLLGSRCVLKLVGLMRKGGGDGIASGLDFWRGRGVA